MLERAGPTTGSKLYLVSACTPAPSEEGRAGIRDAVNPQELLYTLKDKSKKRQVLTRSSPSPSPLTLAQDAKRQKEQDDKPFRCRGGRGVALMVRC